MKKITFTLNGKLVTTAAGNTILEAAQQNGVEIPTLCHDPRLKPTAACRLCLVEVAGAKGPVPACTAPVTTGMEVITSNDYIFKMRQMALELLLSDHYGDCVAPCHLACPAGIDIQGYIALIANGQHEEALKLIKESNPLPIVCGRVCPRFCEQKCRRNLLEGPVAINFLKRFAADIDINSETPYMPVVKPDTGYRIAIIGGGPAGLTAAYYMATEGHRVTIYDANPELGGMLRYGIPEYRLPKAMLDKEIVLITRLCHEVKLNVSLGIDFTLKGLKEEGYNAVFIAIGAQHHSKMYVPGENLPGVLSGIGFLSDVILQKTINLGNKVIVIGGGNTAIDAARTALRCGAAEVTISYRRTREEMPANKEEIQQAELEGVKFRYLVAPTKIVARNGRAAILKCVRMTLGEPDASGRRKPEQVDGSDFTVEVDTIIAAIGQNVDMNGIPTNIQNERGQTLLSNKETMATNIPGVFAGGDCTSGPATVVEAISCGKKVSVSINQYLNGQKIAPLPRKYNCSKGELADIPISDYDTVTLITRTSMPHLPVAQRNHNFREVETGFNQEAALNEASRCLSCGCQDVFECQLRKFATEYQVNDAHYQGQKHHLPVNENEHPDIIRDPNKCILCGRCVRICSEVEGINALGFLKRGFNTTIGPGIGITLSQTLCTSCGQCVSTCPTGALVEKSRLPKPGPWKTDVIATICPECGTGCKLDAKLANDAVVAVTSSIQNPVNGGNLCHRGKFGYKNLLNSNRLNIPLIRQGNKLAESSWQDAISLAARELKSASSRGGDKTAALVSGKLTNEESYLVQKMARVALHTNNIASPAVIEPEGGLLTNKTARNTSCSYQDLTNSDLILVIGNDISSDYPVIASRIRTAIDRGSRLVTVSPAITQLDSLAKIDLKVNSKTTLAFLRASLNYIIASDLADHDFIRNNTDGWEALVTQIEKYPFNEVADIFWVKPARIIEAVHLYIRAKNPVIVVNTDSVSAEELGLITDLSLVTGNAARDNAGILRLHTPANIQGLSDMGISNLYLPGGQYLDNAAARHNFESAWNTFLPAKKGRNFAEIVEGLENGEIETLVVFGSDALGKAGKTIFSLAKFSILLDTEIPQEPPYADIVLPMATFLETEGTYTNFEGRIQYLHQVMLPVTGRNNWQLICLLGSVKGYKMDYADINEISQEIASLVPEYGTGINGKQWQQHSGTEPKNLQNQLPIYSISDPSKI